MTPLKAILFSFAMACACSSWSAADTITYRTGGQVQCVIVGEDDTGYTVRLKTGTMKIRKADVASAVRGQAEHQPNLRIPAWDACMSAALSTAWGSGTAQIPATVIDTGVFKNVPYISYRSGDYEINVYGDPAQPAGIEIGIYRELLKGEDARNNCFAYMQSLLADADDETVRTLDRAQDSKVVRGVTFEITPSTAEDAYGGWWISVYDEGTNDRASAAARPAAPTRTA